MNLIAHFQRHGWQRIAFVGLSKHAGKTTAMNYAIAQAVEAGIPLGLCSIGIDGERLDTILGVAKPSIQVPAGTIVASAERALQQSTVQLEYLEDTGITSPLGNVLIARSLFPGQIFLAGVRQRRHVEAIMPRLQAFGAQLSFVDGAFDRVASAAPNTVAAAVLAIGAVSGPTPEEVAAAAYPFLQRFQLPVIEDAMKEILQPAVDTGDIGIWNGTQLIRQHRHQAILGLSTGMLSETVSHIWIPGAVTDDILEGLSHHALPLELVLGHPAQLLASSTVLRNWFRRGHQLRVWHVVPVAAIAINPHSITGYDLSFSDMETVFADIVPGVPLFNAMTSGEGGSEDGQF